MFRRIPLGRVLGSFSKRGKEEGRKDHHKRRESKGKKRKAGKEEKKKRKGGERGYQMVSASLFFILAKVAGRFLETAEPVP